MKKNGTRILVGLVVILLIIAGVILAMYFLGGEDINDVISLGTDTIGKNEVESQEKVNKNINIFSGTDRPIAVMIDNHSGALPQAGLNNAYITYEMIVEGGETRLMALFKGQNLEKIGPIRSSRHYFLDYALENDAIYVHFGWSPQAQSDITALGVNNINGITAGETSKTFWRVTDKVVPHNAVTNTANIIEMAKARNYSITSDKESVLNYVADNVQLEDGEKAENVTIPYSTSNTVKYVYNTQTRNVYKIFKRICPNRLDNQRKYYNKKYYYHFC